MYFKYFFQVINQICYLFCFRNLVRTEQVVLRPKAALTLTTTRMNEDVTEYWFTVNINCYFTKRVKLYLFLIIYFLRNALLNNFVSDLNKYFIFVIMFLQSFFWLCWNENNFDKKCINFKFSTSYWNLFCEQNRFITICCTSNN